MTASAGPLVTERPQLAGISISETGPLPEKNPVSFQDPMCTPLCIFFFCDYTGEII